MHDYFKNLSKIYFKS